MTRWSCAACTFENADDQLLNCEMCNTLRSFQCAKCRGEIRNGARVIAMDRNYHRECFQCTACHEPFATAQFQIKNDEPYHLECYRTLFLPVCEVCEDFIPMNESGNVVFKIVPFWDMRYCPAHDDRARCCSCHRIEPMDPRKQFDVLSDGRKICHDCALTVVLDTEEVETVIADVWKFLESIGISVPRVPVYLVEYTTLNEHCHSSHGKHTHGSSFVTRGLCLSEVHEIKHVVRRGCSEPHVVGTQRNCSVSAVLILHGLPYDLTAQVLAHEATHAYIKLHDSFPTQLAPVVEEGICQLISYLYLKYRQVTSSDSSTAFTRRLRDFYLRQIEQDQSPVYGAGFRRALEAYERTHSLQQLFDSLRQHGCLP
ncbi:hypothetical protein Poli38472_014511 [Pythium oligandrum]|uniref:LIM zinc-binding domain-containing protein n=2 Tax=Pythiaceae TaxID=4782 RepID=A0A8K1FEY6_PYTOL|nr:hypothetical protein Poli38472_014511 [Pythium oligandrum]DBA02617.1 TPA: hypothetical protein N0F65_011989 [Lagenidium giganteum]|eukprot:TMW61050.1 hypothetical protein Poli38472_014511 [Pythium oligandrum]